MFGVDIGLILEDTANFASRMINNLEPTVKYMFTSFCIIDLILSMLWDESDGLNIFMKYVKKIFYYCFFWYIITDYKTIVFKYLYTGFTQLGNLAGKGSMDTTVNLDVLNQIGVTAVNLAGGFLSGVAFMVGDAMGVESIATLGLGAVVSYIVFFLMLYVQVFTTFIKFYFIAGFAFILMPFAGFAKTKDITSKALNGLFSQAVEIFVLVVMLNYLEYLKESQGLFDNMTDMKEALWTRWIVIFFMYFMITKAGTIASSMLSGAIATLGIGAATMASAQNGMSGSMSKMISSQLNAASAANARGRGTDLRNGGAFKGAYSKAANAFGNKYTQMTGKNFGFSKKNTQNDPGTGTSNNG